jgi:hypothetical protein
MRNLFFIYLFKGFVYQCHFLCKKYVSHILCEQIVRLMFRMFSMNHWRRTAKVVLAKKTVKGFAQHIEKETVGTTYHGVAMG